MHAKSGLTDLVRASTLTLAEAEQQLLTYIKRFVPDRRSAPLCGNSIGTDRGFLARDMPELDDHLHYRMVDVSSIKELARRWFPRVYFAQPPKGLRSEEHTSELQSLAYLVCRLLLEKKKKKNDKVNNIPIQQTHHWLP